MLASMETDHDLIEQVRQRRPGAFEKVYQDTRNGVYGLLLTRTGRVDTAEELLQETYSRFLGQVHGVRKLPAVRNLRAYLLRIARNLAVDEARRRVRSIEDAGRAETVVDPAEPPAVSGEEGETERALRLLRKLPEDQREVIVLRLYNDLGYREISDLTGVPEKTVESRYRYGIQKLRALWETRA